MQSQGRRVGSYPRAALTASQERWQPCVPRSHSPMMMKATAMA